VPVTAIKLFGFFLFIFEANSASSFLTLLFLRYKIFPLNPSITFSDIIILDPALIASLINLFPSLLFPLIAKKI